MSLSDYADELVKIAMGWLGWDLEKSLKSDCLAIQIAYEGRCDMFGAVFGRTEEPSGPEMNVDLFDAMFNGPE